MVKSTCPGVSMILIRCGSNSVHTWPEAADGRGGNGDPALLLLRHPVGCCRAIVYFTQLVAHPGVKQDAFGGCRFTGIDMRGNTDVAITFERDGRGIIF